MLYVLVMMIIIIINDEENLDIKNLIKSVVIIL